MGSLAMKAQHARSKNKNLSRSDKINDIMKMEFENLWKAIQELEWADGEVSSVVARYYQPLCIKDDYGKEHIVPREKCYTWLPDSDPESDAVTWSELLTGVYNARTGKTEPHRLPGGKSIITLLNDSLIKQDNPLLIRLEKCVDRTYIRPHDKKCSTMLRIVAIKDVLAYKEQLQKRAQAGRRARSKQG